MLQPVLNRVIEHSVDDQTADCAGLPTRSSNNATGRPPQPVVACHDCALHEHCLGSRLAVLASERQVSTHHYNDSFKARQYLYRQGSQPRALYIVKSGAVKVSLFSEAGYEQVLGFYLPGEVVGLDALGSQYHRSSAIALESTSLCVIPVSGLEQLAGGLFCLYQLLSSELVRDQRFIELIMKKDAESKLASFLLCLSERNHARGYSASSFNLSMKRGEIGSHLGLAIETVSRLFTRFQDEGILRVERRNVQILDFTALKEVAACRAGE